MATIINYRNIRAEADLYKYSIVPSISSGNLTVALKNYLWQDPSITTPVKVQIWSEVRTITWPLNFTENAWSNHRNCWSAELAWKEVDLFLYAFWDTTNSVVKIQFARIPYWRKMSDFAVSWLDEKWINLNLTSTDECANIWRFSAILWAGASYNWSTPSGWFDIINRPIYETKWLDYIPTINGDGWSSWAFATSRKVWKYKIIDNTLFLRVNYKISNAWSWTWTMYYSLPIAYNNDISEATITWWCCNAWTITNKWLPSISSSAGYFLVWIDTGTLNWWTVVANDVVNVQWFYPL